MSGHEETTVKRTELEEKLNEIEIDQESNNKEVELLAAQLNDSEIRQTRIREAFENDAELPAKKSRLSSWCRSQICIVTKVGDSLISCLYLYVLTAISAGLSVCLLLVCLTFC